MEHSVTIIVIIVVISSFCCVLSCWYNNHFFPKFITWIETKIIFQFIKRKLLELCTRKTFNKCSSTKKLLKTFFKKKSNYIVKISKQNVQPELPRPFRF